MDLAHGDGSGDEADEVAAVLALHHRLLALAPWWRLARFRARLPQRRPGSYPGKLRNKRRNFKMALERILTHYFGFNGEPPVYDEKDFERRFRMPRSMFMRLYNDVKDEPWWQQRPNATGQLQAHPLVKLVAALRVLAYGDASDRLDEYVELSKTTVHTAVASLVSIILDKYQAYYLRAPTTEDLKGIMSRNAERGLPGCIGSLDCSHWQWTNCPTEHHGMYTKGGRGRQRTIVLETVCEEDLWVWHIFAGSPGSNNDLNVLAHSPLMVKVNRGQWPPPGLRFTVNGSSFRTPYYLVDGIYPRYSFLVSPHANPRTPEERASNRLQEALRKDVERLYAVLTSRFHIALYPARYAHVSTLIRTAKAVAILHNMVTELRRDGYVSQFRRRGDCETSAVPAASAPGVRVDGVVDERGRRSGAGVVAREEEETDGRAGVHPPATDRASGVDGGDASARRPAPDGAAGVDGGGGGGRVPALGCAAGPDGEGGGGSSND